jgi:hypothetical protein
MTRYIAPLLFLGTGAYVTWYNANADGNFLLFPFLAGVVGKDLGTQAMASQAIFFGIGGVMLILAVINHISVANDKGIQEEPPPGPGDDIPRSM